MVDDGEFTISLLDLNVGRVGLHPKGIVISRVNDHDCCAKGILVGVSVSLVEGKGGKDHVADVMVEQR